MWGGIIGLIIQLISGAAGGNVAGLALKRYDLGTIGNSIAGVIGGAVGAQILGLLLDGGDGAVVGPNGYDMGTLIAQVASGGVGGGGLLVLVGLMKQVMGGEKPA
jgi:uncharacterized membrane protein YeaQ/YmgE (transglycosylase-associated protein family)